MCGIVGVLGNHEAAPMLLDALKRLEYRGYDSAGVATVNAGGLDRRRAVGKLVNLSDLLVPQPLPGKAGIGHTRWATHGAPTETNAHPHRAGPVAVVHNGIIENFRELRAELAEAGFGHETDTDTETVALLTRRHMHDGMGAEDAARATIARLDGAYALLFFLAAGEEISWGQRIVGWASGDFFAANNYQGETNLHNLKVGEMRLARVLFGSVLTTVLLLYLVVLPLLYPRAAWLRRIADALAVPVPGLHHAVLALLASGVVAAIQVPRNWEVYELVFALLATAIFIAPQNPGKTR